VISLRNLPSRNAEPKIKLPPQGRQQGEAHQEDLKLKFLFYVFPGGGSNKAAIAI
jgi:hypothetical protein